MSSQTEDEQSPPKQESVLTEEDEELHEHAEDEEEDDEEDMKEIGVLFLNCSSLRTTTPRLVLLHLGCVSEYRVV